MVLSYGGGSALLQGVAWATMLSKEMVTANSIEDGIRNTFDGSKSCSLCEASAKLRGQENPPADKPDAPKELKGKVAKEKISSGLPHRFKCFNNSSFSCVRDTDVSILRSITISIDVPPPRLA